MPVVLGCSVLLSWLFCKLFLVVDWVKKDSCSLLLRIYQGPWSLILGSRFQVQPEPRVLVHDPGTRGHDPGTRIQCNQNPGDWTMVHDPGYQVIVVPGSGCSGYLDPAALRGPGSRVQGSSSAAPWSRHQGTRVQAPGHHDPWSSCIVHGPEWRSMPPAPPLYGVRLSMAKD